MNIKFHEIIRWIIAIFLGCCWAALLAFIPYLISSIIEDSPSLIFDLLIVITGLGYFSQNLVENIASSTANHFRSISEKSRQSTFNNNVQAILCIAGLLCVAFWFAQSKGKEIIVSGNVHNFGNSENLWLLVAAAMAVLGTVKASDHPFGMKSTGISVS